MTADIFVRRDDISARTDVKINFQKNNTSYKLMLKNYFVYLGVQMCLLIIKKIFIKTAFSCKQIFGFIQSLFYNI